MLGSACGAHWTDSPAGAHLVDGRWKTMTGRFSWLLESRYPALVMCRAGLKDLMVGTVNSPSLAKQKKEVVRHAKIAASQGLSRSRTLWRKQRISVVNGALRALLDVLGASLEAPSRMALYSASLTVQLWPWTMCHARIPAA